METKKRPSDDSSDPDAISSTNLASGQSDIDKDVAAPTPMDVDTVKAEIAPRTATNSSSPTGETNKRLKMTVEGDTFGVELPSLNDVPDPSKESIDVTRWAEQLDDKDAQGSIGHGIADDASTLATFPTNSTLEPEPTSAETVVESKEIEKDTAQSNHDVAKQDLASALMTAGAAPSAEELNDAILPVASLSEPLMTTLEILESENAVVSKPEDASASTSHPQSTPTTSENIPSVESQDPASAKPSVSEENQPGASAPSDATVFEDASKKDDSTTHDSEVTAEGQDTAPRNADDQPLTKAENPIHEASSVLSVSLQSTSGSHDDRDVDMASPRPHVTVRALTSKNESASQGIGQESKQDDPRPLSKEPDSEGRSARQPMPESGSYGLQVRPPSPQQKLPGAITPVRTSPAQSLPPLSSITPTQPPSDAPQGLSRPSRSSMSVSALLVSNDDDSEQEPDHGRRMSRSIFEQFERGGSQKLSHSPTLTAPISSAHASSTAPQNAQSSGQAPPSSISPHSGSGASLHRMLDTTEMPPLHLNQSGYARSTAEPGHSSTRSQDLSRGAPSKDYPADEVMESGGVSGYGAPRHRLVSPVGVRPLQDSINGSNGGPANNKLPGVGSMTGLPAHDTHHHSGPAFRNEATHTPRQNSYSSSQHSIMGHPTNANGHYPSAAHPTHSSGIPPSAPTPSPATIPSAISSHHPKLIVKNDPSLTTSDRPELFLGYYRYEPALLLPNLEGRENCLVEVRIASPYLTYDNIKVKRRELWGTDIYTDDSDVVAMLIHAGFFIPPMGIHSSDQDLLQPDSQQHNFAADPIKHIYPSFDLAVTLRVMPKLVKYQGSIRNRIKSRTWKTKHDGQGLRIESVKKLCSGEALNRGRGQSKRRMKEYNQERLRVLSNIHDETTESLQNERAMRTATFEFTHQGDPCFKYSPELVMDRHDGLSRKWTSWRLKKEVLILENDEERYEISLQHQAGTDARRFDQYRFAVISPRTSLSSWSKNTYPLNSEELTEVLYEDLDWQDFEWVERGVVVQPSQRTKRRTTRSGSGSLMDGIVAADKDLKHATTATKTTSSPPTTTEPMAMDVEDGAAGKGASQDAVLRSKPGAEAHEALETHQDGVFCVVSRLSWRPRSEQRAARPTSTNTGTGLNVESKTTAKTADKPQSVESSSQHGPKGSTPAPISSTSGGAKSSQEQVEASAGAGSILAEKPNDDVPAQGNAANGQRDSLEEEAVPAATKESAPESESPVASRPPVLSPVQPSDPSKPAPLTAAENAMDVDTKVSPVAPTPPGQPQPPQQQETDPANLPAADGAPSTSESSRVEPEEGELEEGEIASD
ncbi:MAG: hypothetical protein J3Q66DRAFT_434162 [Benniella sp.]|nr:MAG: hypothetical protein J3Q66DRAFT_434162 [Benniella sp.]